MLVDFNNKTPDQITKVQLQDYFLHRKNKDKWSPATMRICYSGIKFFFVNVLKREWHTLELIRAKREQRLPISGWSGTGQLRLDPAFGSEHRQLFF
jgi:integrase/recombinase XerD